jgi:hypothetical protein
MMMTVVMAFALICIPFARQGVTPQKPLRIEPDLGQNFTWSLLNVTRKLVVKLDRG